MATGAYFKREQMIVLQSFSSLASIASKALGGKKKGQAPTPDRVHDIRSVEQLQQALAGVKHGR